MSTDHFADGRRTRRREPGNSRCGQTPLGGIRAAEDGEEKAEGGVQFIERIRQGI